MLASAKLRLDESYRLVTIVLVLKSHYGKIHSIFLVQSRRGSGQFLTAMDMYGLLLVVIVMGICFLIDLGNNRIQKYLFFEKS
jgi:hypothetical protein